MNGAESPRAFSERCRKGVMKGCGKVLVMDLERFQKASGSKGRRKIPGGFQKGPGKLPERSQKVLKRIGKASESFWEHKDSGL